MPNPLYDRLLAPHAGSSRPFLILADGRTLSYADFLTLASRQANALVGLGLKPGDRLAVQAQKSPEALAIYAACIMSGIVLLPLNTSYTTAELAYFIEDSGAAAVICDPSVAAPIGEIAGKIGARLLTLDAAGHGSLSDAAEDQPGDFAPADRDAKDLAALLYTSGTTGRSKGAMLSHGNILANALTLIDYWEFGPQDVLLHALPIFHTHGLFVACNVMLASGGSIILLPKFDVDIMLRMMPRATTMMGVPTFYTRLLDAPEFNRDLTRHMRLFISGSAPLLAETHIAFEARTGHRILERYGMTETNMTVSNPYHGERRAGTVGLPLPGVEVKITDAETGELVPKGEPGMVEVRGANVFQGYWNMPEKTKAELRENGFFLTGDIGKWDETGYLQIVGRAKDLIISGGLNVYPKEVELFLDEQPGVLESAVIGVPHPDFGEAVVGILVASGAGPDLEAIRAAASQQLAKFKQPKELILLPELPRNAMSKVQKAALRETYKDLFQR